MPALRRKLWKKLPEELLEIVLSKAPFSSLVRFRAVSKRWKSFVIPNAVRRGQVRGQTLLLHDGDDGDDEVGVGSPWYLSRLAVTDSTSVWHEFEPDARLPCGIPQLVASEGGLLFCAFVQPFNHRLDYGDWETFLWVWNPVTRKDKILSPPSALVDSQPYFHSKPSVGVIVSGETGTYKLVVQGKLNCDYDVALLYDSMNNSWKCIAGTSQHWDPDEMQLDFLPGRGICYNNIIYFSISDLLVVGFDVQKEIWIKVGKVEPPRWVDSGINFYRIATEADNNEIRLLTEFSFYMDDSDIYPALMRTGDRFSEFDSNRVLTEAELLSRVRGFIGDHNSDTETRNCNNQIEYFGFRQDNVFYHVMQLQGFDGDDEFRSKSLGIVIHNGAENSYTRIHHADGFSSELERFDLFWAFTPSLTASP